MTIWVKRIVLLSFTAASCYLSVTAALHISRTYLFDFLYYGKSEAYGYWVTNRTQNTEAFGDRSKDVRGLYAESGMRANVLGLATDDAYTIAVIGDSEVWGLGVLFEETFPQILQKKLSVIQKTRVLSLGSMGDDVVDNLAKYEYMRQHAHIDLFVFVPVSNDTVINESRKYIGDPLETFRAKCRDATGVEPVVRVNMLSTNDDFTRLYLQANNNEANWCILRSALLRYPKNNALYFSADNEESDKNLVAYLEEIRSLGMRVLPSSVMKNDPRYKAFWKHQDTYFRVSRNEDHPSALAHRMYADALFDEITKNPSWGFADEGN